MKTISWIIGFAVFCSIGCTTLRPEAPETDLREGVATFLQGYLLAIGSRDAEAIRGAYAKDDRFVWIEEGRVRYRKFDGVIASLAAFPSSSPIRTDLKELMVVPIGRSIVRLSYGRCLGAGRHSLGLRHQTLRQGSRGAVARRSAQSLGGSGGGDGSVS